jgi:hypothetical protein
MAENSSQYPVISSRESLNCKEQSSMFKDGIPYGDKFCPILLLTLNFAL